ncbi:MULTISPECIES: heme-binding protein [unclassified Pseudoalteromonas]|nr:heme-binding protein [Pseudoalteromonas sp. XMcav2-N]MCO7189427.1 FABP family protein [Pseudoalteromonas sp. XMcav2-N]
MALGISPQMPVAINEETTMTDVTPPDLSKPLLIDPAQDNPPAPTTELGPLQYLIGTWTNQPLGNSGMGGTDKPFSYCLMPLPQEASYILKNFSYYEELTFSAIHGTAPNRGGLGTQVANTLFYEQRVYFADGPAKDQLVHAENGSLLFLTDRKQLLGPYGNGDKPGIGTETVPNSVPPTQAYDFIKQMSVPHGNSILASGHFQSGTGVPTIPVLSKSDVLPMGLPHDVSTDQYSTKSVGNLNPDFTLNPNQPLTNALEVSPPKKFILLEVDTAHSGIPVTNIGFEQQHANVSRYAISYWLESLDGSDNFTQLQYSQNITMEIPIQGQTVTFPHITTNTLVKKV